MVLRLRAGVASDVGGFREVNQDAAFVAPWGAAVADGVGGGPAGDLASSALLHRLVASGARMGDVRMLATRIRGANGDLGARVRRNPKLAGMATTLTALWFTDGGNLLLAHTGDSRAYLLREEHLIRQTRDDSVVQALVDGGIVSAEEARTHPRRNLITASLRGAPTDLIRVVERLPVRGDRWLLCSDGVSDVLPDLVIADVLRMELSPQAMAERMVYAALRAGSTDNVTAIVADVVDDARLEADDLRFAGSASTWRTEVPAPIAG